MATYSMGGARLFANGSEIGTLSQQELPNLQEIDSMGDIRFQVQFTDKNSFNGLMVWAFSRHIPPAKRSRRSLRRARGRYIAFLRRNGVDVESGRPR